MEKCPYRDIVPENLPIEVGRKIAQTCNVEQCPYARARMICPECDYERFLDENSVERIFRNIKYSHIQCIICGEYIDIISNSQIICLAGNECLLAQEKED